jgi:RNA-directed DNA polymerase
MTVIEMTGAASGSELNWQAIDWGKVQQDVRRLQARIAKAVKENRRGKAKALQWLLTHSFSGRASAVKRVTENQGKRTPGVDGEIWSKPESKAKAVMTLKRHGYRPSPLRRVFIPKASGKMRPLGIPTMRDRAMQALYHLALIPVAETCADHNSYGFRPERASRDAAEQCFAVLSRRRSAEWILDADISGCFDNISHDWLMANILMDKAMLEKWLKAGFVWKSKLFPTEAGTPQGGIISPTLANMTLDGMEEILYQRFKAGESKSSTNRSKVNFIRYADDFVVTGTSPKVLEEARSLIEVFLAERGLALSPEKTRLAHIEEGFDFLGWNIRKYNGKLLIKPAKRNVQAFLKKIQRLIKGLPAAKQEMVIAKLNPVIRGWVGYHQNQVAKLAYNKVDHAIWQQLWRWACRRHPSKPRKWTKNRYFVRQNGRDWLFGYKAKMEGQTLLVHLVKAVDTPIRRHRKIKGEANPFDPAWGSYFEERLGRIMVETLKGKKRLLHLWRAQNGRCLKCRGLISGESGWNIHHLLPKALGGSDNTDNLALLHPICHRQVHSHGDSKLPAQVKLGFQEA